MYPFHDFCILKLIMIQSYNYYKYWSIPLNGEIYTPVNRECIGVYQTLQFKTCGFPLPLSHTKI